MQPTFLKIIRRETRRRGWSGYRLAKESGLAMRSVQNYLAGDHDMTGEKLTVLCETLGLELRPKQQGR